MNAFLMQVHCEYNRLIYKTQHKYFDQKQF